ncbi:MAG: hypothetical protein LBG80_14340 [Bacteroidales bacterium]|nr:hypothetical protein [Bacteroidales bacterium]
MYILHIIALRFTRIAKETVFENGATKYLSIFKEVIQAINEISDSLCKHFLSISKSFISDKYSYIAFITQS